MGSITKYSPVVFTIALAESLGHGIDSSTTVIPIPSHVTSCAAHTRSAFHPIGIAFSMQSPSCYIKQKLAMLLVKTLIGRANLSARLPADFAMRNKKMKS
jgi:hypothetical protein